MRILITAGGTKEYIDGVRYIGNSSSGRTGAQLADHLVESGHDVVWLGAKSAMRPKLKIKQYEYETYDELANNLKYLLNELAFDLIFHAAAVSDFKVASIEFNGKTFAAGREVKLPSANHVQLQLETQPKLVKLIKTWSANKAIKVVAFKLTNSLNVDTRRAAVLKLIQQSTIDYVAHNDMHEISASSHVFTLHHKKSSFSCNDILQLADKVLNQLEQTKP